MQTGLNILNAQKVLRTDVSSWEELKLLSLT